MITTGRLTRSPRELAERQKVDVLAGAETVSLFAP